MARKDADELVNRIISEHTMEEVIAETAARHAIKEWLYDEDHIPNLPAHVYKALVTLIEG